MSELVEKAEWIWGVLDELEKAGLVTLADKGYQGSTWAKIPYRGRKKPEPLKEANRAHAKLCAPGERANAQLKVWNSPEPDCGLAGADELADCASSLPTDETAGG